MEDVDFLPATKCLPRLKRGFGGHRGGGEVVIGLTASVHRTAMFRLQLRRRIRPVSTEK